MQNYYTIYDFSQKKIGLVESVSSTKDLLKDASKGLRVAPEHKQFIQLPSYPLIG